MSTLDERIAQALGWSVQDVKKFSIHALREFVRKKHPKLVEEIDWQIRSGAYITGSAPKDGT